MTDAPTATLHVTTHHTGTLWDAAGKVSSYVVQVPATMAPGVYDLVLRPTIAGACRHGRPMDEPCHLCTDPATAYHEERDRVLAKRKEERDSSVAAIREDRLARKAAKKGKDTRFGGGISLSPNHRTKEQRGIEPKEKA